jgi:putative SOS response-associated peptidase YedK
MIENLIIVSTAEQARSRYHLKPDNSCVPILIPSLLSGGDQAWVITSGAPDLLQTMKFGYNSEHASRRMDLLNLRTDETEREEEDEYDRLMRIVTRLEYSASMRSCRCAVLTDAFLVTSPNNTTYLIHMQHHERPFALAGIYANWLNSETGNYEPGFTLITAAANPMLRLIGIEHMPVILTSKNVIKWIDLNQERRQYLPLIHTFPDEQMNGYPVSGKIFSRILTNDKLQPIGSKLKPESLNRQKK